MRLNVKSLIELFHNKSSLRFVINIIKSLLESKKVLNIQIIRILILSEVPIKSCSSLYIILQDIILIIRLFYKTRFNELFT